MINARLPVVAAFALTTLWVADPALGQERDLSGRWTLKEPADSIERGGLVDDLTGPDRAERGPPGAGGVQPGFGGRGGRGGFGRPRGRGGPRELSEEDRARTRILMRAARPYRSFEFRQDDSTIVLTAGRSESLTLYLDGRKLKTKIDEETEREVKAKWDDGELVVEQKIDGVGEIERRYGIADSGLFMRVETRVEGGRLPGAIDRVQMYRKITAEEL